MKLFIKMNEKDDLRPLEKLTLSELKETRDQILSTLNSVNGEGYYQKKDFNPFYDSEVYISLNPDSANATRMIVEYACEDLKEFIFLLAVEIAKKEAEGLSCVPEKSSFQSTGIVRYMDNLGRVVVPKEIRTKLSLFEGDAMELFLSDDMIGFARYTTGSSLDSEIKHCVKAIEESSYFDYKQKKEARDLLLKAKEILNKEEK